MTDKHKKAVGVIAVILTLLFLAGLAYFIGVPIIKTAENPEAFREWISEKGLWGKILFIGMFFFQIVVAFIPGEPLELCAGYAFGGIEGTVLSLIGIALGTAAVFLLVRTLGVKLCEVFFPVEKLQSLKILHDKKKRNTLAFILMFIPGTPKDLLSYFAGLTEIKFSTWIIISTTARIPSVITSTVCGGAVAEGDYTTAIAVFAVTAVLSGIGLIIYNKMTR